MGWKWGNFSKYGDPDIIGAVKEFHLHQNSIFKHDDDSGKTQTSQTMFDLLKRDKNEDILPMDLPLNDNWSINVYALFDIETWQLRTDLFDTKKVYHVWNKTYTYIQVHSVKKNPFFLVDLDNKVSFPGLQKWFAWRLEGVAMFGDNEILIWEAWWWDTTFCKYDIWKTLVEDASFVNIIPWWLWTIDLLKVRKYDCYRDYDMTFYLWSDGNKYQKNHSGEFEIIG